MQSRSSITLTHGTSVPVFAFWGGVDKWFQERRLRLVKMSVFQNPNTMVLDSFQTSLSPVSNTTHRLERMKYMGLKPHTLIAGLIVLNCNCSGMRLSEGYHLYLVIP